LFNVMSHDPPVVAFSVLPHPAGRLKDTGMNILATREFVINLVSEQLADAMNLSCIDAPPDISELDLLELGTEPSIIVKPPRLTNAPVSFECSFRTSVELGANQTVIFGDVRCAHVPDDLVQDAANCIVDTPSLKLIGAMHAAKFYTRTSDLLEMIRRPGPLGGKNKQRHSGRPRWVVWPQMPTPGEGAY
jgi:flavin reductase (DIM6/NTAB) family NADH-FMN oxidoreductase RutF